MVILILVRVAGRAESFVPVCNGMGRLLPGWDGG